MTVRRTSPAHSLLRPPLLTGILALKVTAEGVETQEQWNLLKLLECDDLQGYVFSRPRPSKRSAGCWKGVRGAIGANCPGFPTDEPLTGSYPE